MAKLHVLAISVNCHGVQTLIAENKLDVTTVVLDLAKGETRTPQFLAINPFHCAPTLEEADGFSLWESNAIMRYLCQTNKLEKWYPSDPLQRAKIDQALDFRQASYYPVQCAFTFPGLGFGGTVTDKERRDAVEAVDAISKHYVVDGKFLLGFEHPTLADLAIATAFAHLEVVPDFQFPANVKAYLARFNQACPSYAGIRAPLCGIIQQILKK